MRVEAADNGFLGTDRSEGDETDGGGHSSESSQEIVIVAAAVAGVVGEL